MENVLERLKTLSLAEKLISAGGVALLIISFLPWYHVSFDLGPFGTGSVSRSGWESPGAIWSILATLIGIVLAGVVLAKLGNVNVPALPPSLTWGLVYLGGAGIAAVCVILKLINHSGNLGFGFFLGIIAVAAMCAGGYLSYTEEKKAAA